MGTRRKKDWVQDCMQLDVEVWVEGQSNDTIYSSCQNQQQQIILGPKLELRVRAGHQQLR